MRNDTIKEFSALKERLFWGFIWVCSVVIIGALGYYIIGNGKWKFIDCLYMTVITISTVGYSEILDLSEITGGRLYTIVLIIFGMGVILYFASTVVAVIVEGEIRHFFRRQKMKKDISKLKDHIILCGAGATGSYVIKELIATKTPFVVIEESEDRINRLIEEETGEFLYIIGDASDDHILEEAGIKRAKGLIAALPTDKDNLFVVISARQLNPNIRIVARGIEPSTIAKLKRAGADSVVSPNFIGGMRMVSEMIRPKVTEFLDIMLYDKDKTLRIEEVDVPKGSSFIGKSLREANLRQLADILVVAVRNEKTKSYHYNPKPEFVIEEGTSLIVLGPIEEIIKLRNIIKK